MTLEHIAYPRREPELVGEDVRLRNWARNATLGVPGSVCAPSTEAELQAALLAGSGQVRMIGSRMSPGRLTEVTEEGGILLDLSDVGASSSSLRREAHWQGPSHRAAGSPSGGSNRLAVRQRGYSVISVTFPPTLQTARLTLNPYQRGDEEDFVTFFQDTRVSQYMGDGPQSEAEDRALFHRVFPVYAERRFAVWAVRRDGRLVGHAEIKHTDTVDGHEIIYALAVDQWGEGLGTELARVLIDYGFNTLGLDQVHATVADDNAGSSKLLERIGFEYVRNNVEDDHITRVYSLARP